MTVVHAITRLHFIIEFVWLTSEFALAKAASLIIHNNKHQQSVDETTQ